ncbi:MAG TPA: hypothetical protein VIO95_04990 [Mycobacterium sp.]
MHGAWSITAFVALLVLGIAAVQGLIWIPIIMWMRRKRRASVAALALAMESETVVRPPEKGVYRGSTAPGYPIVNNNGTIALTKRRLVFTTVTGKTIEIPTAEITGVREAKVFKTAVRGGRTHLVIQTRSGEIGFYVPNVADWMGAVRTIGSGQPI